MKMDKIAGSSNDEFYTPEYAIKPILKYVPKEAIVWCPFDSAQSNFAKMLIANGNSVDFSHISEGNDFFLTMPPEGTTHIISNPPYSVKGEVLESLFELALPFAMLVGVVGLFESQKRFNMFRRNEFEIMYLNRRVAYFKNYNEPKPSLNPPFSSVSVCHKMLPKQIVFEEITK